MVATTCRVSFFLSFVLVGCLAVTPDVEEEDEPVEVDETDAGEAEASPDASQQHDEPAPPQEHDSSLPDVPDQPDAPDADEPYEITVGFPVDFPVVMDTGGYGQGSPIGGFGGDQTTDQSGNKAQLKHRPVILLHGNGGTHDKEVGTGLYDIARWLIDEGYSGAEIWAPSYLGPEQKVAQGLFGGDPPHRSNIDDVRDFIDTVKTYLGVEKVDVVAHSLGCGMALGYQRGLKTDGSFDNTNGRMNSIGSLICLGAAVYGATPIPLISGGEFTINSPFIKELQTWDGVRDPTAFGAASPEEMENHGAGSLLDGSSFTEVTALDDGSKRIHYIALWAIGDIVTSSNKNAAGLGGADLNKGFNLSGEHPDAMTALLGKHLNLLHTREVFDTFFPYLDI